MWLLLRLITYTGRAMRIVDVIVRKRDGAALTRDEIDFVIGGVTSGALPDYQVSALLMAMLLRGMTAEETAWLTEAMVASGHRVDLSSIPGIKVGKHSTGGVGDKTSIIVAPLVAACGVPMPKSSGRGLGHTGGTIDKLESIPGFHRRPRSRRRSSPPFATSAVPSSARRRTSHRRTRSCTRSVT